MPAAIVTCSRGGIVIKTCRYAFPETLDDSRVAGRMQQTGSYSQ
jgi:hypothetical protein